MCSSQRVELRHPLQSLGLFLILAVAATGCSSGSTPDEPVYPVRGVVRFRGQGAGLAVVVFQRRGDLDPHHRSYAKTAADGTFALTTREPHDGAPAGNYVITVTWPPTESEEAPGLKDKLAGRYAVPSNSKLSFEVKPEPNTVPPIDLE